MFLSELSFWKGEWVELSSLWTLLFSLFRPIQVSWSVLWVNSWWPSADTQINYSACLIWEFKASWWNLQNCIMPLTFWDFITVSSIIHWACLFPCQRSDRAAGRWQAAGTACFSLFSWYLVGETCLLLIVLNLSPKVQICTIHRQGRVYSHPYCWRFLSKL